MSYAVRFHGATRPVEIWYVAPGVLAAEIGADRVMRDDPRQTLFADTVPARERVVVLDADGVTLRAGNEDEHERIRLSAHDPYDEIAVLKTRIAYLTAQQRLNRVLIERTGRVRLTLDAPDRGVFWYLGTRGGRSSFRAPDRRGVVALASNPSEDDDELRDVFDRSTSYLKLDADADQWVEFTFEQGSDLIPEAARLYLRATTSTVRRVAVEAELEGAWVELAEVNGGRRALSGWQEMPTFTGVNDRPATKIRIKAKGTTAREMRLAEVEFYGYLELSDALRTSWGVR